MNIEKEQKFKSEILYKPKWKLSSIRDRELDHFQLLDLWKGYNDVTPKLAKKYKESVRTQSEINFELKFRKHFSFEIYPSFWIGNHQVDFLIPRLNAYVEVDGGVHHNEGKMKKDAFKLDSLCKNLKLVPIHFQNYTVNFHFKFVIGTLSNIPIISEKKSTQLLKRLLLSVEGLK